MKRNSTENTHYLIHNLGQMADAVSVLCYIFLCSHNAAFECKITHFISISPPEKEKSEKMLGISQENAYLCNV